MYTNSTHRLSWNLILGLSLFVMGIVVGRASKVNQKSSYFYNNSNSYLKGYQLNLPEEIGSVTDTGSTTVNYLYAITDREYKVIHLGFANDELSNQMNNNKTLFDYGINLAPDSIYIYRHDTKELIGTTKWTLKPNCPIDSIFYMDNL